MSIIVSDKIPRMLPGGDSLVRLKDWARNYIGDELVWDLQLILKKEEVPAASLGNRFVAFLAFDSTADADSASRALRRRR